MKAVYGRLANTNVRFLEFVEKNPDTLKRSNFNLLELNHQVFKLQPWPTFINRYRKNEIKEVSVKICNLIKSLPERIFENDPDKMSRYYKIPPDIVEMQLQGATHEHIENLLARGDYLFSREGFKCLGYNITANLGGWESAIWIPIYLKIPIISKFLAEYKSRVHSKNLLSIAFGQMLRTALKKFNGGEREINLAVVPPNQKGNNGEYLAQAYERVLQDFNLKGKVVFCHYDQLEIIDDYVFFGGLKIHLLNEMYHGILSPETKEVFKLGNICMYNAPISGLISNKLDIALLSELQNSDIFTYQERELIKKYILWTRKITSGDIVQFKRLFLHQFTTL